MIYYLKSTDFVKLGNLDVLLTIWHLAVNEQDKYMYTRGYSCGFDLYLSIYLAGKRGIGA
jgi:hypothetical protein